MKKYEYKLVITGGAVQMVAIHVDEDATRRERHVISECLLPATDFRFYFDFGATRVYYSPEKLWSMVERERISQKNAAANLDKKVLKDLVKDAVVELVEAVFK